MGRRGLVWSVLALLTLLGSTTAAEDSGLPRFVTRLRKNEDSLKTAVVKDGVTFSITSKSGIGSAEVTLSEGLWPSTITLRLELTGLEGLKVSNGTVTLEGSVRPRQKAVLYYGRDGKPAEKNLAVHAMTLDHTDGKVIVVTLPGGFCTKDTKSLKIDWIDFYR